jgi:D-3-phosphoglycerate dehydrogenase
VDNIDVPAATERGVAVLNAPSGNTISAAELAFSLMLSLARRIPAADQSMHRGEWDKKSFTGTELMGKTLGLIGAGRIGGEVARRARAFGMRVVAYDPYLSPQRAQALELEIAALDDVLSQADVVTIHTPLTEATTGLIGDPELATMKRGALLVNASRGGVVDEAALVRALESGQLGGAGLDVYAVEPLPAEHPLRRVPNLVLTPHLGASTHEAQQNVAVEIAQAVREALLEGDFSTAVNAPAIGGEEARRLRPLLDLAERLGLLAGALLDDAIARVSVRYAGPGENLTRALASAVVAGALRPVLGGGSINHVNAMHIADGRGILVERADLNARGAFEEFLDVRLVSGANREIRAAGALVAGRHPRLVRIDRYRLMVQPSGVLLIVRNRDVPGVIGRVGTALGAAGVNIAEYYQARVQAGGEALAAIRVDGRVEEATMAGLRSLEDVVSVTQVAL